MSSEYSGSPLDEALTNGYGYISTFDGTSQYTKGAPSACGLASLNALREVLLAEGDYRYGFDLLTHIDHRGFHEDVVNICSYFSSSEHLDVNDLLELPLFAQSLLLQGEHQRKCSLSDFYSLLRTLRDNVRSHKTAIGAAITRPPEIISLICVPIGNLAHVDYVFLIFDSHSRPSAHENGAAFTYFSNIHRAAEYFHQLLTFDQYLLRGSVLGWQAQLLGSFSAHILMANPDAKLGNAGVEIPSHIRNMLYRSNVELLQARLRVATLQNEIASLRPSRHFHDDNTLSVTRQSQESTIHAKKLHRQMALIDEAPEDGFGLYRLNIEEQILRHATASYVASKDSGARSESSYRDSIEDGGVREERISSEELSAQYLAVLKMQLEDADNGVVSVADQIGALSTTSTPAIDVKGKGKGKGRESSADHDPEETNFSRIQWDESSPSDVSSENYHAHIVERGYEDEGRQDASGSTSFGPRSQRSGRPLSPITHNAVRAATDLDVNAYLEALRLQLSEKERNSDYEEALRQQRIYDQEYQLTQNNQRLLLSIYPKQKVFDCSICMETFPVDFVATVDQCRHAFCRDCLKQSIVFKLEEGRYPVVCPVCATDKGNRNPSLISASLAEELGLSEEQYNLWTQLDLAQYSVVVDCPNCERSSLVDRDDYHANSVIQCPLPSCRQSWCKLCVRHVDLSVGPHSCDGQIEMDRYIRQSALKRCPGCTTPTEKASGCNHITCGVPGCNTHFCYICGEQIARSVIRSEIMTALESHYRRCRLFDH